VLHTAAAVALGVAALNAAVRRAQAVLQHRTAEWLSTSLMPQQRPCMQSHLMHAHGTT
jgi:hypothetical protein